jgi:hypothetical protein
LRGDPDERRRSERTLFDTPELNETGVRRSRLVVLVNVASEAVGIVEGVVTDGAGVVMQRNVLGDAGGRLERFVASGTAVCHNVAKRSTAT